MDEKKQLVKLVLSKVMTMTEACQQFGVSRKTGHKWKERYEEHGAAGLEEKSRAPERSPQSWPDEMREAVLELKRSRPHSGPKKLVASMARKGLDVPAVSTAGE